MALLVVSVSFVAAFVGAVPFVAGVGAPVPLKAMQLRRRSSLESGSTPPSHPAAAEMTSVKLRMIVTVEPLLVPTTVHE